MTTQAKPGQSLPSLQKELARSLTVIGLTWLVAVFLTMAVVNRDEVDELLDTALQEAAEVIYGLLVTHANHLPETRGLPMPAPAHEEKLIWQVVNPSLPSAAQVILRSHKAPDAPLVARFQAGLSDANTAAGHWRVYAMALPTVPQVLYVGQQAGERRESSREVIATLAVTSLLIGLICAVWMRQHLRRAMQPLQALTDQIKRYDPMLPDTQLPSATRQEFVTVRDAIVDLGGRLAHRLETEHAFAAHAAHALRTPLAGMDAQLAVALLEAAPNARERLQKTRDAVGQLKRVVTSLLTLFRSQSQINLQAVDLVDLVAHLPVQGLQVHTEQQGLLRADPNLLAAALANLLDNALRYGGTTCWVASRQVTAHGVAMQHISVRDDGPGATPAQCLALQQRIARPIGDGFDGLGLKLAALVAQAHGGELLIDANRPAGQGFCVTMALRDIQN